MLSVLKAIAASRLEGQIPVGAKSHLMTITDQTLECNASTGTAEKPQSIIVRIDRATGKVNVTLNNYDSIEDGAAEAVAIRTAMLAAAVEVSEL